MKTNMKWHSGSYDAGYNCAVNHVNALIDQARDKMADSSNVPTGFIVLEELQKYVNSLVIKC